MKKLILLLALLSGCAHRVKLMVAIPKTDSCAETLARAVAINSAVAKTVKGRPQTYKPVFSATGTDCITALETVGLATGYYRTQAVK